MDESVRILLISSIVTTVGTLMTLLVTKWIETRQRKSGRIDETTGELALRKFDKEEIIRKEMQVK